MYLDVWKFKYGFWLMLTAQMLSVEVHLSSAQLLFLSMNKVNFMDLPLLQTSTHQTTFTPSPTILCMYCTGGTVPNCFSCAPGSSTLEGYICESWWLSTPVVIAQW